MATSPSPDMTTGVIAAVTAVVSSVITYFVGRPKDKADVHSVIATGASTAVDAITDVLEQVRQELTETREELSEARLALNELRKENAQLRESVALLNIRISDMQRAPENPYNT